MAITAITPRDRLQQIVDLGKKTMRYWWLVALFAVVGGALSLAFALARPKKFQSWTTIFYQERIKSSLLTPNREEMVQRNIGDKYRELLLARAQLAQIVEDPKLNPFPDEEDPEVAIDKLRQAVKLEARGGNAFRVVYTDGDAERARAVTERLTTLLQHLDEQLRNEQANETVAFAMKQKEESEIELRKRRDELTTFLSEHPEFASDPNAAASEGASIRARQAAATGTQKLTPEQQRLLTLERQRSRIQALLAAPPDAPPPPIAVPKSPARLAAEAAVRDAEREVANARRALEVANTKYGPKHPTFVQTQEQVDLAERHLREAKAAVPPDVDAPVVPSTPQDRKRLERQLADVEAQIAKARNAKPGTAPVADTTGWIVQLESQHAELRRRLNEQNERASTLADAVFRATMDAKQKAAETGGRLAVVDPAFKPVKPSGPGKKIFLMGGMVLFVGLGFAIAVLLAVIDDRLYRRGDLDALGVPVLAVIPPGPKARGRKRARAAQAAAAAAAAKEAA